MWHRLTWVAMAAVAAASFLVPASLAQTPPVENLDSTNITPFAGAVVYYKNRVFAAWGRWFLHGREGLCSCCF